MVSAEKRHLLDRMNSTAAKVELGKLMHEAKNVMAVDYDISGGVDSGAVGSHSLNVLGLFDNSVPAKLPDNAIVTNVMIDIITPFASAGGTGTIALTLQSAGDLLAAVDADTLANQVQGVPNNAVANMIKLTADRTLAAVVAVEALTAGKARIFVEYLLSA